jgi:histidine ammonia-lyase
MGANEGLDVLEMLDLLEHVLALELVVAAQAMELRQWHLRQAGGATREPGLGTRAALRRVRTVAPFLKEDVELQPLLVACHQLVRARAVVEDVERVLGRGL